MGVLERFLDAIKLNDDYDDDFMSDDYDDDFEDQRPRRKILNRFQKRDDDDEDIYDNQWPESPDHRTKGTGKTEVRTRSSSKVMSIDHASRRGVASMGMHVFKPKSKDMKNMEDAREIADILLKNCSVILNVQDIDVDIAQRIIDFSAGACYCLGGHFKQISEYVFILAPTNVDISGDFQNILNDGGGSSGNKG